MKKSMPTRMVILVAAALFIFLLAGCGDDNPVNPGTGGETPEGWISLFPKPQGNTLNDVHMTGPFTAVAVGEGGTIMRTINGGSNWTIIRSSNRFAGLNRVSIAGDFGVAVGMNGSVLVSNNGGKTWNISDTGINGVFNYLGVQVLDEDTATIVGQSGLILRTNDGGNSWVNQGILD